MTKLSYRERGALSLCDHLIWDLKTDREGTRSMYIERTGVWWVLLASWVLLLLLMMPVGLRAGGPTADAMMDLKKSSKVEASTKFFCQKEASVELDNQSLIVLDEEGMISFPKLVKLKTTYDDFCMNYPLDKFCLGKASAKPIGKYFFLQGHDYKKFRDKLILELCATVRSIIDPNYKANYEAAISRLRIQFNNQSSNEQPQAADITPSQPMKELMTELLNSYWYLIHIDPLINRWTRQDSAGRMNPDYFLNDEFDLSNGKTRLNGRMSGTHSLGKGLYQYDKSVAEGFAFLAQYFAGALGFGSLLINSSKLIFVSVASEAMIEIEGISGVRDQTRIRNYEIDLRLQQMELGKKLAQKLPAIQGDQEDQAEQAASDQSAGAMDEIIAGLKQPLRHYITTQYKVYYARISGYGALNAPMNELVDIIGKDPAQAEIQGQSETALRELYETELLMGSEPKSKKANASKINILGKSNSASAIMRPPGDPGHENIVISAVSEAVTDKAPDIVKAGDGLSADKKTLKDSGSETKMQQQKQAKQDKRFKPDKQPKQSQKDSDTKKVIDSSLAKAKIPAHKFVLKNRDRTNDSPAYPGAKGFEFSMADFLTDYELVHLRRIQQLIQLERESFALFKGFTFNPIKKWICFKFVTPPKKKYYQGREVRSMTDFTEKNGAYSGSHEDLVQSISNMKSKLQLVLDYYEDHREQLRQAGDFIQLLNDKLAANRADNDPTELNQHPIYQINSKFGAMISEDKKDIQYHFEKLDQHINAANWEELTLSTLLRWDEYMKVLNEYFRNTERSDVNSAYEPETASPFKFLGSRKLFYKYNCETVYEND